MVISRRDGAVYLVRFLERKNRKPVTSMFKWRAGGVLPLFSPFFGLYSAAKLLQRVTLPVGVVAGLPAAGAERRSTCPSLRIQRRMQGRHLIDGTLPPIMVQWKMGVSPI